jgi:hypothetical protein
MRETCIPPIPEEPIVVIRKGFLLLCEGDHCRAAVLGQMAYWTDTKLRAADQAAPHNRLAEAAGEAERWPEDAWIYKSREELSQDLLGLYGDNKCRDALKWLVERGLLETRHNPINRWDRTIQYRLRIEELRARLVPVAERIAQDRRSIAQNRAMVAQDRRSIAQNRAMVAQEGAVDCPEQGNGVPRTGQAIPEVTTEYTSESPGITREDPMDGGDRPTGEQPDGGVENPHPPTPSPAAVVRIEDGWLAEDLARMRAEFIKKYPRSGQAALGPSTADLGLLGQVPRERANDLIKALEGYARVRKGEDPRYTRRLANWLKDWEQWVGAKKEAAPGRAERPVTADAHSPSVTRQAYARPPKIKEAI